MKTEMLNTAEVQDENLPRDLATAGYGEVYEHRRALLAENRRMRVALEVIAAGVAWNPRETAQHGLTGPAIPLVPATPAPAEGE